MYAARRTRAARHFSRLPARRAPRLPALLVGLVVALLAGVWGAPARAQEAIPAVSGDSNTFVEASVDLTEPLVGQQVTYLFRYFEAIDGGQLPSWIRPPDYEAPEFAGFWVEGEPAVSSTQIERNGRTYNVAELRTVLFPTAAGEVTIPPATLIQYDLFEAGERTLETLPVTLNVRPLPEGAPPGFGGAVGDLQLQAQTDRTTVPVGEPIQLRLTLSGAGNVRLAPAPLLRELAGWRILERGSDVLSEVIDGTARGTRTFDYMLIPGVPGTVTLPPIELAFFDPAAGAYRTAQTQPQVLTAEGVAAPLEPAGVLTTTTPAPDPTATAAAAALVPITGTGVLTPADAAKLASGEAALQLRPAPEVLPAATQPLARNPLFWSLWLLPAGALVLGFGARRREWGGRARRAAQQAARSRARAGSDVLRALAPPAAFAGAAEASAAAQQALTEYLQRRLGRPVRGMGRAPLVAALAAQGAPPDLANEAAAILAAGDQARYAPLAADWGAAQQLHNAVTSLIRELDKVLT